MFPLCTISPAAQLLPTTSDCFHLSVSLTSMMRVLHFSVAMFAMMVLTSALVLPEAKSDDDDKTAKSDLVKRSTYCSCGWTGFKGRCFRYIPRPMSWARAEKNCHSLKANLASVRDREEYREIQRLIMTATHEYKETWIGGTDAQEENHWFWIDGTPFRYTNWCPREPNNHGHKQNCLKMNHGVQKCWDDYQCYVPKPSVCARKASFIG